MKSNNYEEEMNQMKNKDVYWNFANKEIDTNLVHIDKDNIRYNYSYRHSENSISNFTNNKKSIEDYDIYSSYNENKNTQYTNFSLSTNVYQFMLKNKDLPMVSFVISLIMLIIIAIYLFWSIGHKKGKEGITLNSIDNIPYEIISIIGFTILAILWTIIINIISVTNYVILLLSTVGYFICYAVCAVLGITTIKRIKAKRFWKSFLTYKIISWFVNKIKEYKQEINNKTANTKKIFWFYWGFVLISIFLATTFATGIGALLLIVFWIWAYYKIRKYVRQEEEIKKALEAIYHGETNIYIDEKELEGVLKQMAIYVNDIAGGLSNAIEENLKAERLKTELITNVSHDIKTPLTSIINYVDLLKKEEIQNDKIKEYIDILDMKSQRLKKLTEDLVEASKASSGNVKLNIEDINLKELINQCIGEFKDKFEEKKLIIETKMPEEVVEVKADNRYMYRIIENLFSNISKYALDNSRVYIDMKQEKNNVEISIKNISKERLNISSDELMQRFVRGDKSRYTEGSGLGLSIAKSLTELQKGQFDIIIDGDLFKVVMKWKIK